MHQGRRWRMPVDDFALAGGATDTIASKQTAEHVWEPKFLAEIMAGRDPRIAPSVPKTAVGVTVADFLDLYFTNYVEAEGLRDPVTVNGRLKGDQGSATCPSARWRSRTTSCGSKPSTEKVGRSSTLATMIRATTSGNQTRRAVEAAAAPRARPRGRSRLGSACPVQSEKRRRLRVRSRVVARPESARDVAVFRPDKRRGTRMQCRLRIA